MGNILFYYVFGLFKIAAIIQQIYFRYKNGFTTDIRFKNLDRAVAMYGKMGLQAIQKNKIDNLSMVTATQRAAGASLANLNTTTTKKVGMWVDELAVQEYLKNGYKMTGKNRMSYCAPEWIADKKDGGILLLDDWNRADTRFIQAVMELIDRQSYISWTLPKDWHIILTANPDNGDYMVNSVDSAQKTRYVTANLKFDVNVWAQWAEGAGIDTRCINFLLLHPELVTQETNARSITTFFNAISVSYTHLTLPTKA